MNILRLTGKCGIPSRAQWEEMKSLGYAFESNTVIGAFFLFVLYLPSHHEMGIFAPSYAPYHDEFASSESKGSRAKPVSLFDLFL